MQNKNLIRGWSKKGETKIRIQSRTGQKSQFLLKGPGLSTIVGFGGAKS